MDDRGAGEDSNFEGYSRDTPAISPEIAELSVNFGPEINNDPADRLIAATSILKNIPIITADQNLRNATILETIW